MQRQQPSEELLLWQSKFSKTDKLINPKLQILSQKPNWKGKENEVNDSINANKTMLGRATTVTKQILPKTKAHQSKFQVLSLKPNWNLSTQSLPLIKSHKTLNSIKRQQDLNEITKEWSSAKWVDTTLGSKNPKAYQAHERGPTREQWRSTKESYDSTKDLVGSPRNSEGTNW